VITAVAANLGGVEELLAARPGSWEADRVRQIVYRTVGEDEQLLLRYRTEPIVLRLDPEDVFYDVGLDELYQSDFVATEAAIAAADDAGDVEQLERAEQLLGRVEELWTRDLGTYHAAYEQTIRAVLAARGVTVPFQLRSAPPWATRWLSWWMRAGWLSGCTGSPVPAPRSQPRGSRRTGPPAPPRPR
jgi:hypothetical protein